MMEVDRPMQTRSPVGDLEHALFLSLNPVDPDPEFVTRVRHRIERQPTTMLESRTFWEAYVIVACGFFVGVAILWLIHLMVGRQVHFQ